MKTVFRKLSLFAILGFFFTASSAQLYKVELDEKVSNASLIIEGKVTDKKSFWNDAHTMIFTDNTIEVYKIFKGNITGKTVHVLTQGGSVGTKALDVSDLLQFDKEKMGILFCSPNNYNLHSPETKELLLDVYSSDQGFLRYDLRHDLATAPFASYKNIKGNLYPLLEQKTKQQMRIVQEDETNTQSFIGSSGTIDNGVAAATITSFSPASVHAGALNDPANNVLTINGSGFGATPSGSCAVLFKDGNNNNVNPDYKVAYTSNYIISWSDSKIVLKVPSRAATGNFAVVLKDGTTIESPASLDVLFSVLNLEFGFPGIDTFETEPRLMNANGSGGYTFQYSTNTAGGGVDFSTSPAKQTFQRALATWKAAVGANLTEGPTTTVQKIGDDGVNIVVFDNANTGYPVMAAGVLEVTYSWGSICYDEGPPFKLFNAQKTGFDILIRNPGVSTGNIPLNDGPCFPQPGSNNVYTTDLEMIILHEIGHALDLAHINDDYQTSNGNNASYINPGKVMHYSITNYVDRRSLDNAALVGAQYSTKKQNNSYGNCGLFSAEMSLLSTTLIANDDCPSSFPQSATAAGTVINVDLAHATSNKFSDPQFTAINCNLQTGESVTNNAFAAIKTGDETSLNLYVNNYTTTPPELSNCADQGVRLAVYAVGSCPAGQNYPQPIACRIFTTNGGLTTISGLSANQNYLLYFDGLRNTKATFDVAVNDSTAIPPNNNPVSVKLYPNPVQDILNINIMDSAAGKYQFVLYDMLGRILSTQSVDVSSGSLSTYMPFANLARGVYILKIIDAKGAVISKQKIFKGK